MKFLLDESAEYRLAAFLADQGHDVTAIAHDYPYALTDAEVLRIAQEEQRTLITNDRDFGELAFHRGMSHCGIVLFRLPPGHTDRKIAALRDLLTSHANRLDQFIVVGQSGIRARRTRTRRRR